MKFRYNTVIRHSLAAIVSCAMAAPLAQAESSSDKTSIITLLTKAYPATVNASDGPGYSALFTTDGSRIPPERKIEQSRKEIGASIKGVFSKVSIDVTLSVDQVEVSNNLAWATGTASGTRALKASGAGKPFKFRTLFILKKEAGNWRIHRLMWNASPSS